LSIVRQSNRAVQIRFATLADAQAISTILRQAFVEFEPLYTPGGFAATTPTAEQIEARWDEGPVWIALLDGKIVGTVSAVPKGDSLYIRSMAVLPEARGHHVGERLLDQAESYAHEHGLVRLFLSTTPFLDRAIALYEKYGFQRKSSGPQDLFGTPIFSMEKFLT
jgi:N-acetylglutamate synthase-like GNAT family acetyltransferase